MVVSVFPAHRQTYLTGSPQRVNIVGRGTHSGQVFVVKDQPCKDTDQRVIPFQHINSETSGRRNKKIMCHLRAMKSHHAFTHISINDWVFCRFFWSTWRVQFSWFNSSQQLSRVQLCRPLITQSAGKQRSPKDTLGPDGCFGKFGVRLACWQ